MSLLACTAETWRARVYVEDGPAVNQALVTVVGTEPRPVALRCTSDEDPSDVLLFEDPAPTLEHALRVTGLAPSRGYHCLAVATEGRSAVESATIRSGPAPVTVLEPEIPDLSRVSGWWTLAVWTHGCDDTQPSWLVAWDRDGLPRWWWQLPEDVYRGIEALWHPDEGVVAWGGGSSVQGFPRLVDPWEGEVFAADVPGLTGAVFHHDGKLLADGRVLALTETDDTDGLRTWRGFGVDVWTPGEPEVDVRIRSQRYFDEGLLPDRGRDPVHANWADVVNADAGEELWVSLCFGKRVLRIDAASGDLLGQFGPRLGWTALDADGAPLDQEDLPHCQHGLEVDGDRVLVFDNGQGRGDSRAGEWQLDWATKTARRTWHWTESGWSTPSLGDIDALPGDHVLLGRFEAGCAHGRSQITEVDRPTGEVVGRWWLPLPQDNGYRAERIGGCDWFPSAAACPAIGRRVRELEPVFRGPAG